MVVRSPFPKFVLTGPSGWIGQAMLSRLSSQLGDQLESQVKAFASRPRRISLVTGGHLDVGDLSDITSEDVDGAHVIHLAYLTKDKVDSLGHEVFADINFKIDSALLSALDKGAPASLFVASSGAAVSAESGSDPHPYAMSKLQQERRFLDWARASGTPTLVGRIFNVAGPYINKLEAYAISNFALQGLRQGRLTVEATNPVFRSFLHVNDFCDLVIEAGRQRIDRAYPLDFCGSEVLEMGDLARLVAESIGCSQHCHRPTVNFDSIATYLGNFSDTKILAMELNIDLKPIKIQIDDTVSWIRDSIDENYIKNYGRV